MNVPISSVYNINYCKMCDAWSRVLSYPSFFDLFKKIRVPSPAEFSPQDKSTPLDLCWPATNLPQDISFHPPTWQAGLFREWNKAIKPLLRLLFATYGLFVSWQTWQLKFTSFVFWNKLNETYFKVSMGKEQPNKDVCYFWHCKQAPDKKTSCEKLHKEKW